MGSDLEAREATLSEGLREEPSPEAQICTALPSVNSSHGIPPFNTFVENVQGTEGLGLHLGFNQSLNVDAMMTLTKLVLY